MGSHSPTEHLETNKAIVRQLFEFAWNEGKVETIERYLASEIQFHFRGQTRTTNADDLRSLVTAWQQSFPDLHFQIHQLIAQNDLVAARLTFTGTHYGSWRSIEPTGRSVQVNNMWFFRLTNNHIVEVWEEFDEYGLRHQLTPSD